MFAFFIPLFPIAGRITDTYTIDRVTGFLLIDTLLAGNPQAFLDAAWHIILPAFALALSGIGQAARLTRANMVETYDKPYIEMAQALAKSVVSNQELKSTESRISRIFRCLLTRKPTPDELTKLTDYYKKQSDRLSRGDLVSATVAGAADATDELAGLTLIARVLMNLDETISKQ